MTTHMKQEEGGLASSKMVIVVSHLALLYMLIFKQVKSICYETISFNTFYYFANYDVGATSYPISNKER